ncbi:MAG: 4-phosphoerythronate dehydrogenase [Myxococcales bacterium]|nr:4-phosphoerythronate dehydrogenase [Myxococcales bacterium]MCB9713054.1 4-phosphoerythronate dehydrogenase [Myxococcales bacterium]
MGLRIVIDDAIPWKEEAFGHLGKLRARPGTAIDRDVLQGAEALVVRSVTKVDARLLQGTSVRFVASATAGMDHIEREELERLGVTVAHAPGCNAQAVAEWVVSALAHAKRWRLGAPPGPVGVVGLGHVGRRVARALRALGYDVMACDPPLAERRAAGQLELDHEPALSNMARFERLGTLERVLESSFVISLHVPLTRSGPHATWHMLGYEQLSRLRHGQLLVNTCRGGVIDDDALHRWVHDHDGKALVDVWENEPRVRPDLLHGPGAVQLASPHVAGYTFEGKLAATRMVHEALCRYLGRTPDFDGRKVLARKGTVELRCDDRDAAHDWRPWIASALPLMADDARIRGLASRPAVERASGFEALRRHYPLRRELSAFFIRNAALDPDTHRQLSALGIHVPPEPTAPPKARGLR